MKSLIFAAIAMLLSIGAWAQQAPPAGGGGAPGQPCIRGASQVTMAGVNIDELKCELAVVRNERAVAQERLERTLAAGSLVASDLEVLRKNNKQHETDLAEWFKGYFGQ